MTTINHSVSTGAMNIGGPETPGVAEGLIRVACNLCGSSRERLVVVQNSYRIVRCVDCGFVYVNPRPDVKTLERLYLKYLPDKMNDPLDWESYMKGVFSRAADALSSRLPKGARVLDAGCGYGFFLKEMRSRGFDVRGMDVSKTAADYARRQGFDVALGTFDDARFPDGSFDAVTMFYVLEHVTDPLSTLVEVRRILKPGGVVLLRLPHTTPIVRLLGALNVKNNLYDPPFHLSDFSASTIKALLEKAGFVNAHTFIGGATSPPRLAARAITASFGLLAEALYVMSLGRLTMPGAAKNTVAYRNAGG